MKLIVCLGNPGPEYEKTRHNVGFLVADSLARRYAPDGVARSRFHALTIEAMMPGGGGAEKAMIIKPTTYMNKSGVSVSEAAQFYKVDLQSDLLVIVDDVALPCGQIRLRSGGSAGGHNGLGDIEQRIGTADYARLRIGIDPPGSIPQKDYVLGRFRPDQIEAVEDSLDRAVDAAAYWVREGITATMNTFNQKLQATNQTTDQ